MRTSSIGQQALGGLASNAVGVRTQIQSHIRSHPGFAWAQQPYAPPPEAWLVLHWRWLVLLGVGLPAAGALVISTIGALFSVSLRTVAVDGWIGIAVLAAVAYGLWRTIRHEEDEQTYVATRQPDSAVRDLAATQNRPVINEMTVVGPIKEGRVRPLVLRLALWVVERLVEGFPKLKDPAHHPDGRDRALDRRRRRAPADLHLELHERRRGLRARLHRHRSGRGEHQPVVRLRTRLSEDARHLQRGAITNPNAFGYVVTANQRKTAFWYGRYTDISIDNIAINRQIREGLFGPKDETEAQTWLHLL